MSLLFSLLFVLVALWLPFISPFLATIWFLIACPLLIVGGSRRPVFAGAS